MTTARLPLTHPITSRSASTAKDSRSVNCLFESAGGEKFIVKRPGVVKFGPTLPTGVGRGLMAWDNSIIVASSTSLYEVIGETSFRTLGALQGTQQVSFVETLNDGYLALQDGASLYYIDKATRTFTAPSGAVTAVSINERGGFYGVPTNCTVATGTPPTITAVAHGLVVGQGVTFTAATLPAGITLGTTYQVASVPTADTFTINTATTGGGAGAAVAVTTTGTTVQFLASPTVTFSAGTVTAAGVATLYNHQVSGVIVTAAGTYTSVPTVTFSAPPAGTTASSMAINGYGTGMYSLSVPSGGSGYLVAPSITFTVGAAPAFGVRNSYSVINSLGVVTTLVLLVDPGYTINGVTATFAAPYSETALGTVAMANGGITGPFAYGLEYLDGYVFVATTAGRIYQSNKDDPTTWGALNFIEVNSDPDSVVALARQLNYLVAFGQWSTEVFYNAGNPTGSILGNNKSAKLEVGCAAGGSVAKAEHTLLWIGQSKTEGRSVYLMEGLSPIKVSNKYIEKYLNKSTLATVHSYCFKLAGHTLYVLTLSDLDLTFVYDIDEKEWYFWSSSSSNFINTGETLGMNNAFSGIFFRDPRVVKGERIVFSNIVPGALTITLTPGTSYYIKDFTPNYMTVSSTVNGPAIAFGPTGQSGFFSADIAYFGADSAENAFMYTSFNSNIEYSADLHFQHGTTGQLYRMSPDYTSDDGTPIFFRTVSPRTDSGTTKRKFYSRVEVVGDKAVGNAQIRHTDDDYQTWSNYRTVDLSKTRPILYQNGAARRRAWELLVTDNIPVRLEAIESDFDIGEIDLA